MAKDFYEILGVSKSATQDEIKKAYRKLAHKYHPDTGRGDEAKFKEVNEAYNVLGDPERRRSYDQYGAAGPAGVPGGWPGGQAGGFNPEDFEDIFSGFGGGAGDVGDMFSDIFGFGRRRQRENRGVDVELPLTISFQEAVSGVEKEIPLNKFEFCQKCKGEGAEPGHKVITCPKCHGQGQIRTAQQTIFGAVSVSRACDQCSGVGKVPEKACTECGGSGRTRQQKTIKVSIPAGIDDGSRIRVTGGGEVGYRGTNRGDLYIAVAVEPDPRFQREGNNIYSQAKISFVEAALGGDLDVPTVDGQVSLSIPPGTQSGAVFRLKNKGMPILGRSGRGDHFVNVTVEIPKKLSRKQKELLEQFKKIE